MSDLSASHCGCGGNSPAESNNGCCNSIIWIIILFFLCGNGNGILGGNDCNGNGIFGGRNNGCGCEALIVLILLFSCCGNNNNY
ncbi:MAG: chorion class high-cysteine HCB protein 13 [Lachnospiraceae bacterium]|nr:chorion class high-cysteine HCB protein 13 [Lachnospiraceae bacterium]